MLSDITIVVPTYNVEKYIAKCLKSLMVQTYSNFKILVINDGSIDNSVNIVKDYMKKDSRICLIEKENGGYGSVLECALRYVRSKYFLICDPDDWLEKDALLILYNFAEKNDLDLVVGDKYEVFQNSTHKKYVSSFGTDLHIEPNRIYNKPVDIQRFSLGEVSPHAKLFKTKLAKSISFPHHVSYTDTILYVAFLANAKRVSYINKPLANYYIDRPGNTMTDVKITKIFDLLKVWDSIFNQIKDNKYYNSTLLFYLYILFMRNLNLAREFSNKELNKSLLTELKGLQSVKNVLMPYGMNKVPNIERDIKSRIIFKGLMNKNTSKIWIKIYAFLKSNR